MEHQKEIQKLRDALKRSEKTQTELDRTVFNLKTLYDISTDIYSSIEPDKILRNFLLMCMGNFGSKRGFLSLGSVSDHRVDHFTCLGYKDDEHGSLQHFCEAVVKTYRNQTDIFSSQRLQRSLTLPENIELVCTFYFEPHWQGVLILDAKIVTGGYTTGDREMLQTLVNTLVISLKNAKFYEEVWALNQELDRKNVALKNALKNLRAEMRKVEILESVKENLSKFVPMTVTKAIEKSPTGHMPESRTHDLSVLFLDIEGYTRLCEKLGSSEVNSVIEKHFSVFMDAIHENDGDVNETAGDGLMVLFLNEDKRVNAMNAARTALTIQRETAEISKNIYSLYKPLEINMGINSGSALVGAAKFDSLTGSRWTYTARGSLINVAARLGAQAAGGQILVSKSTADRIAGQYALKDLGRFQLKNVTRGTEIYQLQG